MKSLKPKQLKPKLGVDFPTNWARRKPARMLRSIMIATITRPIINVIARPKSIGADRLLADGGPFIFAVNHSSHLDTSVLLTALPSEVRKRALVAARHDYFFDKYWKAILWSLWINTVPIDRDKVSRKTIKLISELIDLGWHLVIYPEASRGDDDFLDPFRPGAAYLATHTSAAVVPTHIDGTRKIFPPYMRRLRPGRTRVVFGTPLRPMEGEKSRDFNVRIENAVATAADEGRTDWWSSRVRAKAGTTPTLRAPTDVDGWRRSWAASQATARPTKTRWPI